MFSNHIEAQFRIASKFALLLILAFAQLSVRETRADLVKLSNGGELRGRILPSVKTNVKPEAEATTLEFVQVESLTGASVVIARSDIQFITLRSPVLEEYETLARRTADTLEAQWELAEWCRAKGLSSQRTTHLLKVVEHDADHQPAQTALGRVWEGGAWVDREELMASKGYIKHKGQYITQQELEVIQKTADELEIERKWFQDVRKWELWLNGRHEERRQQALTALQGIDDNHAAPAVIKLLCEDANRELRLLGVTILSKLKGAKVVAGLAKSVLYDNDAEIRFAALSGITPEGFEYALPAFVKQLRHESNLVVSRAAQGLTKVGDERAIAPLIDALVTSHRYFVPSSVPNTHSYRFGSDGNFASGASGSNLPPEVETAIRTGQLPQGAIVLPSPVDPPKKMVPVRVEHANADVLTALQKLTDRDFGFDERTWHLWWSSEKSIGKKDALIKK